MARIRFSFVKQAIIIQQNKIKLKRLVFTK